MIWVLIAAILICGCERPSVQVVDAGAVQTSTAGFQRAPDEWIDYEPVRH